MMRKLEIQNSKLEPLSRHARAGGHPRRRNAWTPACAGVTEINFSIRVSRVRQRGSVYILVLGVSLLVTVLGVGALMAVRVERDRATLDADAQQARRLAESAIDLALLEINNDPAWRTTHTDDVWVGEQSFAGGAIDWKLDDADGDLADDDTERIKLIGAGRLGDARQRVGVTLEPPVGDPLEALDYAVRVEGTLNVGIGQTFTATGGAGVSVDTFSNQGTLVGEVVAALVNLPGVLGGNSSIDLDPPDSPPDDLFDRYATIATPLTYSAVMDGKVLAPGYNDYGGGATNSDGVYYINTSGANLIIRKTRVHGTLLIDAGGGCVKFQDQIYIENYRSDYPAVIIRGDAEFAHTRNGAPTHNHLREADHFTNYNPAGAEYLGVSDADQADEYPNEIRGLVHVIGDTNWANQGRIRGSLLVEGDLTVNHNPEVVYNLDATTPIWGYTDLGAGEMTIVEGSWQRVVE